MSWVKSSELYTNPDNSYSSIAMFGNSYTGDFEWCNGYVPSFQFGQFFSYDLKPIGVLPDAKFAMLGGILIITGAADLLLAFRAPGSTTVPTWNYYQEQLLSPFTTGGERSVNFDLVPLVNGCFECAVMAKKYPDDGTTPAIGDGIHSVGWNIKLKAWGR